MIPIHELLNRTPWVKVFGQSDFEIGYHGRIAGGIIRVPLREVFFEPGDNIAFDLIDTGSELHSIPLQRIKQVFRNGELSWHQ
jgi:hypothetical protein